MPEPSHQDAIERVLVVHEDVTIIRLLRDTLNQFTTAEVVTTPDAQYAFELGLQREYKLFIIQLSLPVLNGELLYDLIGKAYRFCGTGERQLPAVIFLADGQDTMKCEELMRDARVKGVLLKPLNIGRLLGAVGNLLRKKDQAQSG